MGVALDKVICAVSAAQILYPQAVRFGLVGSVGGSWGREIRCSCGCSDVLIAWGEAGEIGRECFDCLRSGGHQLELLKEGRFGGSRLNLLRQEFAAAMRTW